MTRRRPEIGPHEQRLRRARSPLQRLARERAAGVADDRAVLGDPASTLQHGMPTASSAATPVNSATAAFHATNPQPLVENEQRIPRDVLRCLPHAHGYAAGAASGLCEPTAAATAARARETAGRARRDDSDAVLRP